MKKMLILTILFMGSLFMVAPLSGQQSANSEDEAPIFTSTLHPTADSGVVAMVFSFTHPRIPYLKTSVWMKDLGETRGGEGSKRLVRRLQVTNNRQPDTVFIRGLADQHYYKFGVDFQKSQDQPYLFTSSVLEEGYKYAFDGRLITARSVTVPPPSNAYPCQTPNVSIQVEPEGYCQESNRPAVVVQCKNCYGQNWRFAVEVRTSDDRWRPLRPDGKLHDALGTARRTEPLCILDPGVYFARVMAWGNNCKQPIIETARSTIVIPEAPTQSTVSQSFTNTPRQVATSTPHCTVRGEATLRGDLISGSLELDPYAPCAQSNPYAIISYVHQGYRDIVLNPLPLTPGGKVPFGLRLDQRDLTQGIHPIQVVVYAYTGRGGAASQVSSFILQAGNEGRAAGRNGYAAPASLMKENFDTIGVTATDPNCTQIQNLELVYDPNQLDRPLFISWLSPRCCQMQGCSYSVWAGPSPDQLRLIVNGNKPGALVHELLRGQQPEDKYYEVEVHTPNGKRKAAYVLGEGAKYGIEEIMAYRDKLNPQRSNPLVFQKANAPAQKVQVSEPAARPVKRPSGFRWDDEATASREQVVTPRPSGFRWNDEPENNGASRSNAGTSQGVNGNQPQLPISGFDPCQYKRETEIITDMPVREGSEITIKYDHSRPEYKYTLYHKPAGASEWLIAPGTRELQDEAVFTVQAGDGQVGKYLILAYKPAKKWGCLSASLSEPLELKESGK